MSIISKFAGRVVCTKEQFNALTEKDPNKEYLVIDDDTYAELTENNRFTGLNTFTESTQFNKGIESDGGVAVSNSVVKIMNNSDNGDGTNRDYVAQYDADGISLEENGNKHTVKFPNSDGTTIQHTKDSILHSTHRTNRTTHTQIAPTLKTYLTTKSPEVKTSPKNITT